MTTRRILLHLVRMQMLLLCLWMCASALAADGPLKHVPLSGNERKVELWSHLLTLPDEAGKLTPEQVEQQLELGQGDRLNAPDQSYGRWLPFPYWAGWELHNTDSHPQTWLLSYVLPTQDSALIWQKTSLSNTWQVLPEWQLSDEPHAWFSGHLWPVWTITLQPGETRRFLLRLDGYNRMRFPLELVRSEDFSHQHMLLCLGIGFVFAIPCVVLVYALTLWPSSEDRSIPLFVAMALCEMLGAAWVSGLLSVLMPWLGRDLSGWLGWAGYVVVLGLSGLHARIFLGTKGQSLWADRVLLAVSLYWLVGVPVAIVFYPDASRLTLLLSGVVHTLIFSALALRALLRERSAHMALFLAVWLIYLGSGVLYILYRVLHLPVHYTLIGNYVQGSLVAAFLGAAVTAQLINKRKLLQQQLERTRERAMLQASAQHDLMQPLQSLRIYTQQLAEAGNPVERQNLLARMQAALRQLNDFLPSLRHLWGESALPEPQWTNSSVHDAIGCVVDEWRDVAQLKQLHLRYRPCHHMVRTDVLCLQRIVRNLLSNAVRYTPPGGDVLLACRNKGGRLWLLCWDTGAGMPAEQSLQCFEAFTRFDTEQKIPEGLGLGLFSVRELARSLDVPTWLNSRPGHGTCIGVALCAVLPLMDSGLT